MKDIENQLLKNISQSNLSIDSSDSDCSEEDKSVNVNTIKYQRFMFQNFYTVMILLFLFVQMFYSNPDNTDKYFSLLVFLMYYIGKKNFKAKKKKNKE